MLRISSAVSHSLFHILDLSLIAQFTDYEARTTGSFVEIKNAAITFHHRNADPLWGEFQAKECQAILESMQGRLPIDVMVVRSLSSGKCAIPD